MSNKIPGIDELATAILNTVTKAIEQDVNNAIDKSFEEAKMQAKAKAGSIAVQLASMVDFQTSENRLVITIRTDKN